MMDKLHFGKIVLLNFPFTDGISFKPRPALIINDLLTVISLCAVLQVKYTILSMTLK